MNSAIVDINTNIVENIIVAEPVDPCPFEGFFMVGLAPNQPCNIGWVYDQPSNTFNPPA